MSESSLLCSQLLAVDCQTISTQGEAGENLNEGLVFFKVSHQRWENKSWTVSQKGVLGYPSAGCCRDVHVVLVLLGVAVVAVEAAVDVLDGNNPARPGTM